MRDFKIAPNFLWHSSLICLLNMDNMGTFSEERRAALEKLAARYHLAIGVSNVFGDIAQFAGCVEQARTALNFSGRMSSRGRSSIIWTMPSLQC